MRTLFINNVEKNRFKGTIFYGRKIFFLIKTI
ncbi:MAG: hypothetical protein JWR67_2312 [Mucilaginibacter sp.]|nr:hypothetical protein [Mucilaginibacter sp.]